MEQTMEKYPRALVLLHWLVAVIMIATLSLGWLLDDHEELINVHRSLGVCVLAFALLRLGVRWRLHRRMPDSVNPPGSLSRLAEKTVHTLLYFAMVGIPLLGWFKSNAAGHQLTFFGWFALPTVIGPNPQLSQRLGDMHSLAATGFAILLGAHVAAALLHGIIHRYSILKRIML
jgi:cytochrome b561